MGFSVLPPRPDTALVLPTLTLAAAHSDAGLIQLSIPWQVLLDGTPAPAEVRIVRLPSANYYRATGRPIAVALDVTDGLDRSAEAPELVAAGRSITEPAVQALYREYASAVDSILRPEYLSLAAETNLIRAAAPAPVYATVVTMTGATAAELRSKGTTSLLLVSSYPYLGGFSQPEQIPLDYYSRLNAGRALPELVLAGGWPSVTVGPVAGTPDMQARYIRRQAQILDQAEAAAVFQITFTDLDLSASPPPPGSILPLFALGLVDSALGTKPALAVWDSLLALERRP